MATAPDLTAVKAYLGDSSYTDDEITSALNAEIAAQQRVCRVPEADGAYPDDLGQALMRRVSRNLAMKALPLGLQTAMSEAAVATIKVGSDSEVRRLEAPWRKVVVG